jgi:hypothetical protein
VNIDASLVRSEDFGSGVGVQFTPRANSEVTIRYSREFLRPVSESETLLDLGVEESWHRIIVLGVLGSLISSADVDAVTQDFITESLEAQGFSAGTALSFRVTLERLRANEILKARRRLLARDGVPASYRREL